MFEYRPNIGMGTLICSHYYLLMLTAFVHKFGPSLIRLWKHNSDREDRTQTTNDDGGGQQTGTGTKASSSCRATATTSSDIIEPEQISSAIPQRGPTDPLAYSV